MIDHAITSDRLLRGRSVTERFLETASENSFADLFHTFRPQLVAFFRARSCGLALAEDLTQDVMLAVHCKAAQLRDHTLFRAWLFKIARKALARHSLVIDRFLCISMVAVFGASAAAAQEIASDPAQHEESKRILWIVPNYRTSPSLVNYEPLTVSEKFKLASEDSFDRGTVALAALFGGEAQLTNANRAFGQGAAGFGRYVGAAYGDLVIGDYMSEAVFPSLFHQDPRYFRRGTGTKWSRLGFAVGQIFWTHRDSGGTQFNFSEIVGNSAAVAISNAYYVDNRNARDAVSKLGVQIGVDMVANILKEFWPDLQRKFRRKQHADSIAVR